MIFQPNLIVNVVEPTDRGRLVSPYPFVTHHIGGHKFPLTTSKSSSVYQVLYSGSQPFSGPAKQLTFLQLGNCETPDLMAYAGTCKSVDFNGHIHSTRTAFEVISQLPKVTKVAFLIGQSQQHSYTESFVEFLSQTPVSSNVRKLKILVDLDHFHSFYHDCSLSRCNGNCLNIIQYSIICLVESILKHAADSFPNLRDLTVELPENDTLCQAVQMLIQACPNLRKKTQTSVQSVLSPESIEYQGNSLRYNGSNQVPVPWNSNEVLNGEKSIPCVPVVRQVANIHYEATFQDLKSPEDEHEQFLPSSSPFQRLALHRPPPGFAPLSYTNSTCTHGNSNRNNFVNQDVRQRVNNWLSSLEN